MDGRGSRNKGNRFERRIAAIFSDAFGMNVRRVPASGGLDIKCDLYCPEDDTFPFYIECKYRETFRIQSLMDGTSDLFKFFKRNKYLANESYLMRKYANKELEPIVVFKGGDFKAEMVMTETGLVIGNMPFVVRVNNLFVYKLVDFIEFCDKSKLH